MANSTIDFEKIKSGQKASEVSEIIDNNLELLANKIALLEYEIEELRKSASSGSSITIKPSVVTQISPDTVILKTNSLSQTSYVTVMVACGDTQLKPGKDDSVSYFSYSLLTPTIVTNNEKIATVTPVTDSGVLKFRIDVLANATNDGTFQFTVTFYGNTNTYNVPVLIVNNKESKDGQSVFTSTVFKRTNGDITRPTGGSYSSPVPNGWSDGIPSGSENLYTSHRCFTSDGNAPQDDQWSTPILAQDSADIDVCYSSYNGTPEKPSHHGSQDGDTSVYNWHDSGTEDDIWMAMSTKSGNEWSDWSILKIKGENGANGDWKDSIYKECSSGTPLPPNLTNPDEFVDKEDSTLEERNQGWHDVPSANGIWWMSTALIAGQTGLCIGEWSDPVKVTPEDGVPGQACYVSTVFCRKASQPDTPIGGSYSSPVPDGWSDGIPQLDEESNPIWESHRRFTNDGNVPQDDEWTTPKLMMDSADFDCCYSSYSAGTPSAPTTHGEQSSEIWHNEGTSDDIWMATSYKKTQGDWSNWTITRIKGENGKEGDWTDYVFKKSDSTPETPDLVDPTKFSEITDPTDKNYGWQDGPGTDGIWWMSCALIDGSTGMRDNNDWSTPVKLTGEKGVDGSYTEYQYKANNSEYNHPSEDEIWYSSVSEAYSGETSLPDNYYLWMRQRRYNGSTGKWGSYEYMRVTGEKGEPGTSVELKGTVTTYKELFSLQNVVNGDSYILFDHMWTNSQSSEYRYYSGLTEEEKKIYNPDQEDNFPNPGYWIDCGIVRGPSGSSMYIHIKYATILDLTGKTSSGTIYYYPSSSNVFDVPTNCDYIGVVTDTNVEAPDSDYSIYTWGKFTGDDGYGYEYIYKLSQTETPYDVPTVDTGSTEYQKDDYVPSGWTDNPNGITQTWPYEYMCSRKKVDGKWQSYKGQGDDNTKAVLYSSYGKDASYIDTEFAAFDSLVYRDDMATYKYWSKKAPTPASGEYVWQRQRVVTPARGSSSETYSTWEYIRVSGEKGDIGTGITLKGTKETYAELFALGEATPLPDDGDSYLVLGHIWSWASSATDITAPDEEKYGTTIPPHKWQDGGQIQGPEGKQGKSGDTYYIHFRYSDVATLNEDGTYTVENDNMKETTGKFIGVYTSTSEIDSEIASDYKWSRFNGEDGLDFEYIYTRTGRDDINVPCPVITNEQMSSKTKVSVVSSYNEDGTITTEDKSYQENDWVPYSGTIYNSKVTNYNWTDNPMGVTAELPYEWACKRTKTSSVWGAFIGKASKTTEAFLYHSYGSSPNEIELSNQIHQYHIDASGHCDVETVVCKIIATNDGITQKVSDITVTDNTDFETITVDKDNYTISITNKQTLKSGGTIEISFKVNDQTYTKYYSYSVVTDGSDALTIYFNPESIIATEKTDGTVDTAQTQTTLTVLKGTKQLTYNSDYTVEITNKTTIDELIEYETTGDDFTFHITKFNKNGKRPLGGTVDFSITCNGTNYSRSITWVCNWLGTYVQTISGDVATSVSERVINEVDSKGYITSSSAQTMIEQSAEGLQADIKTLSASGNTIISDVTSIKATVTGISSTVESHTGDISNIKQSASTINLNVTNLSGNVSNLVLSANTISGSVFDLSGNVSDLSIETNAITTNVKTLSGDVATTKTSIEGINNTIGKFSAPNLLANSLLNLRSNYYWFRTKHLVLKKGTYTVSTYAKISNTDSPMSIIVYLGDENWDHRIVVENTEYKTLYKTFEVSAATANAHIGCYLTTGEISENNKYCNILHEGDVQWLKIEEGSGCTGWIASEYDSATDNILLKTPYEVVTSDNSGTTTAGTLVQKSDNLGDYVEISGTTTGKGWQLIWPESAYTSSLICDGTLPNTLYYYIIAKNKSGGDSDTLSFGSLNTASDYPQKKSYDYATMRYFDTSSILNTKNASMFSLNDGWNLYYASTNMLQSNIRMPNLLYTRATYKVSLNDMPSTTSTLSIKVGTAVFHYYELSGTPQEKAKQVYEKTLTNTALTAVADVALDNTDVYFISKTDSIPGTIAVSDGAKVTTYGVNSGSLSSSGGVFSYNSTPTTTALTLVDIPIVDNLIPECWYTLSFKAKDEQSSSLTSVPLRTTFTYNGGSDEHPIGDNLSNGVTKMYWTYSSSPAQIKNGIKNPNWGATVDWPLSTTVMEYSCAFMVSASYDTSKSPIIRFAIMNSIGTPHTLTVKDIKLEKGGGCTGYYPRVGDTVERKLGINNVIGTWDVLAAGISRTGIPSIESINSNLRTTQLNNVCSEINQTISSITSTVSGMSGDVSEIKQASSDIQLNVQNLENGLKNTGIDITNRKIVAYTDSFVVASDSAGTNPFMSVTSDGVKANNLYLEDDCYANNLYLKDGCYATNLALEDNCTISKQISMGLSYCYSATSSGNVDSSYFESDKTTPKTEYTITYLKEKYPNFYSGWKYVSGASYDLIYNIASSSEKQYPKYYYDDTSSTDGMWFKKNEFKTQCRLGFNSLSASTDNQSPELFIQDNYSASTKVTGGNIYISDKSNANITRTSSFGVGGISFKKDNNSAWLGYDSLQIKDPNSTSSAIGKIELTPTSISLTGIVSGSSTEKVAFEKIGQKLYLTYTNYSSGQSNTRKISISDLFTKLEL